jgi:hypothetical protein
MQIVKDVAGAAKIDAKHVRVTGLRAGRSLSCSHFLFKSAHMSLNRH